MNKVCATCGRENASDAFQCHACRSRDFGGNSPTKEYRAIQKGRAANRQEALLQEAIESYKPLPGSRHKPILWLGTICSVLVGVFVSPGEYATYFQVAGAVLFGWLMLLYRMESYRRDLERRFRKSQQNLHSPRSESKL